MIEGKYTNAARMVQQLSAAHRWCVTGTPLQQGVYGEKFVNVSYNTTKNFAAKIYL